MTISLSEKTIMILGIIVAILAMIAIFFVPEVRNLVGLESLPMDQLSLPLERGLSSTSVTLTGTVDTGTPPMRAWFEYDKNYDSLAAGDGTVMPQVAGSPFIREGTYPVEQYITNLSPNTTYYYRLIVSNDYEPHKALNIKQFTTPSDSNKEQGVSP